MPEGIERVDVPANGVIIIVRANRNLGNNDVSSEAREFVNSLGLRLLSQANDMFPYVLPPEAFSGIGWTAYQLRFPAAGSFWSLTAYNNDSMTLIPNEEGQYNVPGYRQGLVNEADGSVVIYIQQERPAEALVANWLPFDGNPFHLMLRVYEPEAPCGDYDPPTVKSL